MKNQSISKMLNLLERIDNDYKMLVESQEGGRRQVSRDEILDVLDRADESGKTTFASFTYITDRPIYNRKSQYRGQKLWRGDDVKGALNKNREKHGESDWFKNLDAYANQEEDTKLNPITGVIAITRYVVNWISPNKFTKRAGEEGDKLRNLRMSYGVGLDSNGMLGDNHNQRYDSGYGQQRFNQTDRLLRDFNMAKVQNMKSTPYFVDSEGHIVTDLPNDIYHSMSKLPKEDGEFDNVEKGVRDVIGGNEEAMRAYSQAKAELEKDWRPENKLMDAILCIVATVDGEQLYYINDAAVTRKNITNANQSELVKLAKKQIDETFNALNSSAFSSVNEWHEPDEYYDSLWGSDEQIGAYSKDMDDFRRSLNKDLGVHGNSKDAFRLKDNNWEDDIDRIASLNSTNRQEASMNPTFKNLKKQQEEEMWDAKDQADSDNQWDLKINGEDALYNATNWNVYDEDNGYMAMHDWDKADAERHMNENRFKRFIKETVKSVLKENYGSEAEEENNAAYARQRQAFEKAVQILQQLGIRANGDFRESPKIYTDLCWREDKSAFDKALRAENILKKSLGKYGDWVKTDNEMSGFISFTI